MMLRQFLIPRSLKIFNLPPTYLLPFCARLSTTPSIVDPKPPPPAAFHPSSLPPPPSSYSSKSTTRPTPSSPDQSHSSSPSEAPPQPSSSLPLLPLLAAQPPHYIIARIHQRPYLLTHGDSLRLPFHLHGAPPGTVLRLTRASALGSRDYTFRGKPWVDEKHFVCRVRVVGVEGEPMRVMEKTKRRQRHIKTVKSKMRFTVVRCIELRVLTEAELEGEAGDEMGEDRALEPELTPEL